MNNNNNDLNEKQIFSKNDNRRIDLLYEQIGSRVNLIRNKIKNCQKQKCHDKSKCINWRKIKAGLQIVHEDIKDDTGLLVFTIWAICTSLVIVGIGRYETKILEESLERTEQHLDKLIQQRRSSSSKSNNEVIDWYSAQNNLKSR